MNLNRVSKLPSWNEAVAKLMNEASVGRDVTTETQRAQRKGRITFDSETTARALRVYSRFAINLDRGFSTRTSLCCWYE